MNFIKKNNSSIIKILITLVIILLPINDILRITFLEDVELFGFSIIELPNLFFITLAFILTILFNYKKVFKDKKLIIYSILLLIYLVLHSLNIMKFDTNITPDANQNIIVELYYIYRVYLLPLLLFYTIINNKKIFNKEYFTKIIRYLIIFISGSIIVCNLLRYSFSSYPTEYTLEYFINKTSFYDVFMHPESYKKLLTCGLFTGANQISIILVMLLPFNLYLMYQNPNKKNIFLVFIQCLSMLIIGTKTASLGSLIELFGFSIMYIFFIIIKKEKWSKTYYIKHMLIFIIMIILTLVSPFIKVLEAEHKYDFNKDIKNLDLVSIYKQVDNTNTPEELSEILNKYPKVFKINNQFYDIYPIENDMEFWKIIAKRDRKLNNNYRILKKDIINRIVEKNNNKKDKYYGIGYTLNFMDIEKDYVYQYYLFGIIGLLFLVLIYIILFITNIIKCLTKKTFTYKNCALLIGTFFGLILCYFSGHLFGWVSPMIILVITISTFRNMIKE